METINGIQVAIEKVIEREAEPLTLDVQEYNGQKGFVLLGQNECC
ncbi:hypothetical protein [Bacillus alkalicellulosilyticus]|nr:hypothetical protein [Bacillus alkalicellulosilyticus]